MSRLRVYADQDSGTPRLESYAHAEIAARLHAKGIRFERWQTDPSIRHGASPDAVMAAYRNDIDRLMAECGYQAVDVVSLGPDHPDRAAFRQKFLNEHTHSEDEVRFFVAGRGLFSLHLGDEVWEVLCEQGDLIGVPDNTKHWFDMGPEPHFVAIRLFTNPAGWVANFSGDDIATRFSRLETPFVEAIVTDIEGTTSDIDFVKHVLFPYARERLPAYVRAHLGAPEVREALTQTAQEIGGDEGDVEACIDALLGWIDEDRKITPLKSLQGLIWKDGYANGDFTAHMYQDAPERLKHWQQDGKRLFVYSSGSVPAQQLFFKHSQAGDLTPLFEGYFDTRIGGKRERESYERIAAHIGVTPSRILFLSDIEAELDAAQAAGWRTAWLRRKDFVAGETTTHLAAPSFNELEVQ